MVISSWVPAKQVHSYILEADIQEKILPSTASIEKNIAAGKQEK